MVVQNSLPHPLILQLKEGFGIQHFVEGGTSYGVTATWAAAQFAHVTTIEAQRSIYEQTVKRHGHITNIRFLCGDTREALQTIVPELDSPALFWLDAHWSAGETFGEGDECPLLDEIRTINASPHTHFLFIDDAHMFMSPPPLPHRIDLWPTIDTVIETLKSGAHKYYIIIFNNGIIAVPPAAHDIVATYCQQANTAAWHEKITQLQKSVQKPKSSSFKALLKRVGYKTGLLRRA